MKSSYQRERIQNWMSMRKKKLSKNSGNSFRQSMFYFDFRTNNVEAAKKSLN